ncbi:MAG: glycosyltransferase family 4 protein [Cyanobacteriota bacterium]|nr:glycosyltransferase family 4 protein [Cyanobacteriota bacterium]
MKKICFISNEAARTGAPAILLGLIQWIQAQHQLDTVNVLLRDGALRTDFERTGPTHTWIPTDLNKPERLHKRLAKLLRQRGNSDPGAWLTAILEKEKPDIIYLSTLVLGKYLQQFRKLPHQHIVSHVHELLPSLRQLSTDQQVQTQLGLSDLVIACAPCVAETLSSVYQLPASKTLIIPEYITPPSSGPEPLPAESLPDMVAHELGSMEPLTNALRNGTPIIGIGGNPINRKGFDLFPLLVRECKRQFADSPFHAVWIGCGEGSAAHVAMDWDLTRMGLADHVSLVPSVSMPVFRWLLSRFAALTLLSREDPFPLVVLEAGVLGVPTVCFEGSGAIPDLAAEGCCVSVPYLDLPAFAAAVRRLCLQRQDAQEIAARCGRHVSENLSLSVVAPRVAAVLLR